MGRPAHPARLKAIAEGRATYLTGNACNLGGIAERKVNGSHCLCDAHKAMEVERAARGYQKNREYRLLKQKVYADENRESVKATHRRIYRAKKSEYVERAARWANKNADARRRIALDWARRNGATVLANVRKRQTRKLNATPPWFGDLDGFVMQEAYDLAKRREAATGIKWEVDHTIPLRGRNVCGLHVGGNIQVIPMTANRRKSNSHAAVA